MKTKTFPKIILVIKENEGTQDEFYSVNTDLDLLPDEPCDVAVYELSSVKKLTITKMLK